MKSEIAEVNQLINKIIEPYSSHIYELKAEKIQLQREVQNARYEIKQLKIKIEELKKEKE